jgi:hypothetical protein
VQPILQTIAAHFRRERSSVADPWRESGAPSKGLDDIGADLMMIQIATMSAILGPSKSYFFDASGWVPFCDVARPVCTDIRRSLSMNRSRTGDVASRGHRIPLAVTNRCAQHAGEQASTS